MKKALSLVLALVMVLGSFSMVSAAPASDVVGTEYESAVERLSQLGILEGYPDGTFKPAGQITRAEFAAVVVRAKGLGPVADAAKGLPTGFTDVPATSWMAGYVGTAAKLGIVNGVGNGMFAPNAPVKYEEAVTMIMRALGYEPAAVAKGGYPYGYLIVANEQDLLESVKGTQGLPALRGTVAQLADNALEIPMMIQVGYGVQTKWVVSGTEDTKETNLLDALGFKNVEGMVSIESASKNQIKVTNDDDSVVLTATKGFDLNFYEGLTVKAWYSGKTLAAISAKNEAKYDAVEIVDTDTIKLVGENKKYDLVKGLEAENADYAKVVLNKDGKVEFVKYYNFEFIVVNEVKNDIVFDLNDDELDLEDYVVINGGKTVTVDDLEKGDVLFFDSSEDFALVYNESKTGEIERVYSDSVKVSGKVYNFAEGALYLDDAKLGKLSATVLDEMKAEADDVELFLNYAGEVVLVIGARGVVEETTTSFIGFLTSASTSYTLGSGPRAKTVWTFDVFKQDGKSAKYDLEDYFVKNLKSDGSTALAIANRTFVDNSKLQGDTDLNDWDDMDTIGTPVKVTLNKDGDITKVEKLVEYTTNAEFNLKDTYVRTASNGSFRLQPSTLVFYNDGSNDKVVKVEDAKNLVKTVDSGAIFVESKGRVLAVFAGTGYEGDDEYTTYTGLVTNLRKLSTGKYQFNMEVAGKAEEFITASKSLTILASSVEDKIVEVYVSKSTGEMVNDGSNDYVVKSATVYGKVKSRTTLDNSLVVTVSSVDKTYELMDNAVVYDNEFKNIGLRGLNAGDTVDVYFDGGSTRFVAYVVRTAKAGTTPPADNEEFALTYDSETGKLTAALKDNSTFADYVVIIGDDVYTMDITRTIDVSELFNNRLYKANLVKITASDKVLATVSFVGEAVPAP